MTCKEVASLLWSTVRKHSGGCERLWSRSHWSFADQANMQQVIAQRKDDSIRKSWKMMWHLVHILLILCSKLSHQTRRGGKGGGGGRKRRRRRTVCLTAQLFEGNRLPAAPSEEEEVGGGGGRGGGDWELKASRLFYSARISLFLRVNPSQEAGDDSHTSSPHDLPTKPHLLLSHDLHLLSSAPLLTSFLPLCLLCIPLFLFTLLSPYFISCDLFSQSELRILHKLFLFSSPPRRFKSCGESLNFKNHLPISLMIL